MEINRSNINEIVSKASLRPDKDYGQNFLVEPDISKRIVDALNLNKNDSVKISKIILLSPVNKYKGEYKISKEVSRFDIPTYIFYGQFDKVTDVSTRYSIFQNAKNNPNVHFFCYPAIGHYLYYACPQSMELEKLYRNSDFDLLVGETRKNKIPFLPSEAQLNETFFKHLFNVLEDKQNKKRIGLLTDVFPLFVNGVEMVVQLLKKELDKLGYETYVIALWK